MVAAGLTEEEAAHRLESKVLITYEDEDQSSFRLAQEAVPILSRTLDVVRDTAVIDIAAELVLGQARPRTSGPHVFVSLFSTHLSVSDEPIAGTVSVPAFSIMTLIAACYASGAIIFCAVGQDMPNPPLRNFEIHFSDFIPADLDFTKPMDLREAYLAGAGAIGNGFLWAARHVPLTGRLHVADDDVVSGGNLQRQIWFVPDDIGDCKAEVLCKRAQTFMPGCELIPSVSRLQQHKNRNDGPWLKRLIVGVDSRRARRELQKELPGEVFDASTSGSREIVLHHNKQPSKLACMGCLYSRDKTEISHEEAVAEHLGLDPVDLHVERISAEAAVKICTLHPQLKPADIEGFAFESLYKQLCSSGQLKTPSGKQVIAPFAFVSVLAGALLLLEIIRQQNTEFEISNEWRINPWMPPVSAMRQLRARDSDCECCGRKDIQTVNNHLWGVSGKHD